MTTRARFLAFLFALLGLASSSTSLYVHHRLLTEPGYASFCDINQTFSCANAYLSPYGSIFGIPIALPGVLWFLFVLVLVGWAWRPGSPARDNVPGYLFAMSTLGLAIILYLGYAAFFLIKAVCVLCLVTYVAVIGLFIVSGIAASFPMRALPGRALRDVKALMSRPVPLAAALVLMVGAGAALAFFPRTDALEKPAEAVDTDTRSDFERYYDGLPRLNVPVSSGGAAVTIVKFTDVQCPTCGSTYFSYKPILQKYENLYPGAVRFVTKQFPLDTRCNSTIPRAMHAAACEAAAAILLARETRREAEMEDWLYTNAQTLTPAGVKEAARTIGQVEDFEAAYTRVMPEVQNDIALAQLLQVKVTPTFFINGAKQEGGLPPTYFDLAIQYELKKAGKLPK